LQHPKLNNFSVLSRVTEGVAKLCGKQDIMEIKPDYIKGLKFHYLRDMIDVLDLALVKKN